LRPQPEFIPPIDNLPGRSSSGPSLSPPGPEPRRNGFRLARGESDGLTTPSFGASLRRAQAESGRSRGQLLAEMLRLAAGPGRLTPAEYFDYRLYDDRLYDAEAKREFLGHRLQVALNDLCNRRTWRAIADDKLVFADLMRAQGLPVPVTVALHHPYRRYSGGLTLPGSVALRDFLRTAPLPLFGKPVGGIYSAGTARLESLDPTEESLVLAGVGRVPLGEFEREVAHFAQRYDGYLFQELMRPDAEIEAICGDRIANVRFVVLLDGSGPRIARTACKIPASRNVADNFWRPGNLLAAIDVDSGRLTRVLQSRPDGPRAVETHPDTGRAILGWTHPRWGEMRDLCLTAATTLPGLRIQAWDIALCRQGPVLQEVNVGGTYRLQQLADRKGMLDMAFREFLDREFPRWERQVARLALQRSVVGRLDRTMRLLARRRGRAIAGSASL